MAWLEPGASHAPHAAAVAGFTKVHCGHAHAAAVPALYLRQMAAYRALLRQAFPGRRIECALVWTHGARLLPLPEAVLDRHAPGGD